MDYLRAQAGTRCTEKLTLPEHLNGRLLGEHLELVKRASRAIEPFHFQATAAPGGGVQIEGDTISVLLGRRVLEKIGAVMPRAGRMDMSLLDGTISAVIDHTLKRELVFRIDGLPHPLRPLSLAQVAFLKTLLDQNEKLVIGSGPTGTGKTHLAIAGALNQLALERVKHIVVTRPHVVMEGDVVTAEVRGEMVRDQQFDFFEDIMRDLVGYREFSRLVEQKILELMPLGRMRGRTFNDAFVIVDEAQNMTVRMMRMVVTRLGWGSRMVITGDPAQNDLRGDEVSGLPHLVGLLAGSDIARIHQFERREIVRNSIVARLEELYARETEERPAFAA
jgi:phosphate starvation-inducible PhoH-like protein